MGYPFLIGIIVTLSLINFIVTRFSRQNKYRCIWSGVILILTTFVFFTMMIVSPFDPIKFGTDLFAVLNNFWFFVNVQGA